MYNLITREILWLFCSIRRMGYGVNYLLLLNTFIPLTFLLPIKLCFSSLFLFYRARCSPWVLLICRPFVFIPQRPFIDTVGLAQRFRHTSCPFSSCLYLISCILTPFRPHRAGRGFTILFINISCTLYIPTHTHSLSLSPSYLSLELFRLSLSSLPLAP